MNTFGEIVFLLIFGGLCFFGGFIAETHSSFSDDQKVCESKWVKVEVPMWKELPPIDGQLSFWIKVNQDGAESIGPISISCDEGCSTIDLLNRENESVIRMDQRLPAMD